MALEIRSRDNEQVKFARKVAASPDFRRETGLFFAEGLRLCADIAQNLPPVRVFCVQDALAHLSEALGACAEVYVVSGPVADKLCETRATQGVFALFCAPRPSLDEVDAAKGVLMCEHIQDPGNIGAMVRSAAAFGFGGVVLSPGCADPFSPKALRGSAGAVVRLPVLADTPLETAAGALREQGAVVLAAAAQNARPPWEMETGRPFALLVGNEGAGLSEEALALADQGVFVPMQAGVESLNAAVAASVLMYALGNR